MFYLAFFFLLINARPLPRPEHLYRHDRSYGKIGVLNFATPDVWAYAQYSVMLWQLYADLHAYEFYLTPLSMNRTRHDVWTKVLAVEQYLPKVDYLLFAEADTFPFEQKISVEKQLIEPFWEPDTLFMLGTNCARERYCWDEGPNTGVFLVKNTPKTFELLRDWWNAAEPGQACERYYDWHPREQLTFWHCIMENSKYAGNVKMINYKFIHGLDGTFIHHLLGFTTSNEQKIETMRNVYIERGLNRTCTQHDYPCSNFLKKS